jgi:hypothetical protein
MGCISPEIAWNSSALRMEANTPQLLWILCVGARSSSGQPDPTLGGKRPEEWIKKKDERNEIFSERIVST